jgi:hypothetical protein
MPAQDLRQFAKPQLAPHIVWVIILRQYILQVTKAVNAKQKFSSVGLGNFCFFANT